MPTRIFLLLLFVIGGLSCQKEFSYSEQTATGQSVPTVEETASKTILVDASKDGGGWWFPQTGTFSADAPHQGKALADHLRTMGYKVEELGRGITVTKELLNRYKYIIRATAFFPYTADELQAYNAFLQGSSSLLLISDHLLNAPNDALSARLGLQFSGAYTGEIVFVNPHATTDGTTRIPFIGGSVLNNQTNPNVLPLGYLAWPGNIDNILVAAGILKHPKAKIFFLGDINGLEEVPQPFTKNLMEWLFPL